MSVVNVFFVLALVEQLALHHRHHEGEHSGRPLQAGDDRVEPDSGVEAGASAVV